MERVQQFLNQILRNSFLSKREKAEWKEEMQAHIEESISDFRDRGYTYDQAVDQALRAFGRPGELRERLTEETFGFSTKTIFWSAAGIVLLSVILEVLETLLFYRYGGLPLIIGVTAETLVFSLFLTRKRIDRICLLFTPVLFMLGFSQAFFRFLVDSFGKNIAFLMFERLFFAGVYDQNHDLPFSLNLMLIGSAFLVVYCLLLYFICKNRSVAVIPFVFSIVYLIIYTVLIHSLYPVSSFMKQGDVYRLIDIGVKAAVLAGLAYILRLIDRRFVSKKQRNV